MKNYSARFLSILAIGLCIGCEADQPEPATDPNLPEPMEQPVSPPNSMPVGSGIFTSFAHSLSGTAVIVIDKTTGTRSLRLQDFSMTAGPDVYVMLSKSNNYSMANSTPIGILKGSYSNNNLSLPIEESVDLEASKFVLIYCLQFNSLFGFAEPE